MQYINSVYGEGKKNRKLKHQHSLKSHHDKMYD